MTKLPFASVILAFGILTISQPAAAQCPAFGADTSCGVVITISTTAAGTLQASLSFTGQGPYDSIEDTLVGVINSSNIPIRSLGLTSSLDIFGFDGDGIDTYGAPGNAADNTGYGGPNAYFTVTGGVNTVNFITPIAANGGTAYFSLEESLSAATTCSTVINNSISTPSLGGGSLISGFTNISATFKPVGGYTLGQAATLCGFTNFDWIQQITHVPDPSPFCESNSNPNVPNPTPFCGSPVSAPFPIHLTSMSAPFNDPAPNGYTYNPSWVSYPFYWDPNTTSNPWSLAKYETLNGVQAPITTADTLSSYDSPADPCISGPLGTPSIAYVISAAVRAVCGNSTTPSGSYIAFTTQLAGITASGTGVNLGVGYSWTSNFNGTQTIIGTGGIGGIATTASYLPVDPSTGAGGITVTAINEITSYQYPKGSSVVAINGTPVNSTSSPSLTLLQGSQIYRTASGLAYSRANQTFNGTVTLTNISTSSINGPFQIVFGSLTAGVTLTNATGSFGGSPYLTVPSVGSLAPGQSTTVNVQFKNSSNTTINFTPIPYSGSFN